MKHTDYNKYPATKISGEITQNWQSILAILEKQFITNRIIAVDLYTGIHEEELINELSKLPHTVLIDTRDLFKSEDTILEMTSKFITDDVIFGYITNLDMSDYFDLKKLSEARKAAEVCSYNVLIIGSGAALVCDTDMLIYADMARWEIQQRFRRHEVKALGIDNRNEAVSLQYKRGYFNDWRICDKHKRKLYHKIDFWLDTHIPDNPKMISRDTFFKGIEQTIKSPFRVVPFFDPAPWGGQWMKTVCGLDDKADNFGWCFDCVPEENSLLLDINGTIFQTPSVNLVYLKSTELLGEPVEARFGKEFPIRFDFLDTMKGGNLSLQVHPTTQYIQENFGLHYTQDESYYIIDAEEDATVYIGMKTESDKDEMIRELTKAQNGEIVFDAEKYTNVIPAKKHDHFLIPGGTIHCSGANSLVLEISATPNIFTFKLWDWARLGLDGKPRPINIERGSDVINTSRNTEYVYKHLRNVFSTVSQGEGWVEEKTGLHPNEPIETRRHWFTVKTHHHTQNSVNVLNLIEGDEVVVESPENKFDPFIVHYAETFIIPAALNEYTITPHGKSANKKCATIKAYVRF